VSSLFIGFIRRSAGPFPSGNHPETLGTATRGRRSCARQCHRQTSPSPAIVKHRSLGGLITGSFAVGATWLTYWHNRRLNQTQQQKRINGLLSAIRNEVEIAGDIYRRKAGNALEMLPDGKPFYSYVSLTESFFIVYPNNTGTVGQIPDRELCKAIIETYNTANYVIEGLRVNNWYLDRVSKWRQMAETSHHARMSIPEVEKRLVDYAPGLKQGNIALKQHINGLIARIDDYLPSHQV
jgi:hypothetical protein